MSTSIALVAPENHDCIHQCLLDQRMAAQEPHIGDLAGRIHSDIRPDTSCEVLRWASSE